MPLLIRKKYEGPEQKEWKLEDKPLTVGRDEPAEIRIDDPEMSRQHFRITCADNKYFIEDLDSHNGTFVDGKRAKKSELPEMCMIQAGRTVFEFTPGATSFIRKAAEGGTQYRTYVKRLNQQDRQ